MNETWQTRLIGAAVVLAVALGLTLLLPNARKPPPEEPGVRIAEMSVGEPQAMFGQDPIVESLAEDQLAESPPDLRAATEEDLPPGLSADGEPDIEPDIEPEPGQAAPSPAPVQRAPAQPTVVPPPAPPKPEPKVEVKPKPEPKPAAPVPKPTPPPAATPAAPKPVPPAATARAGRWYVQAGAYASMENARRVESGIRALGLAVTIGPIESNGNTLYRVSSGPFPDNASAQSAARRIAGTGVQTRVVDGG